jgi:hypothetical protein
MESFHQRIRRILWANPDRSSLTEHQASLASELDPDSDFVIRGGIGSGKTFTARHYLSNRGILFKYFSANELLQTEEDTLASDRIQAAETVLIDNFDVIPAQRDPLERIYKKIETHLSGPGCGLWLIMPADFQNDWFESCLGGYQEHGIDREDINNIHADHVYQNLQSILDEGELKSEFDPVALSQWGYHAVITSLS